MQNVSKQLLLFHTISKVYRGNDISKDTHLFDYDLFHWKKNNFDDDFFMYDNMISNQIGINQRAF